jgi:hypothetical protein
MNFGLYANGQGANQLISSTGANATLDIRSGLIGNEFLRLRYYDLGFINDLSSGLYAGFDSPINFTTANPGSIYFQNNNNANGAAYLKISSIDDTGWERLLTTSDLPSSSAGTLDDAYNFGGAGLGRTINLTNGPLALNAINEDGIRLYADFTPTQSAELTIGLSAGELAPIINTPNSLFMDIGGQYNLTVGSMDFSSGQTRFSGSINPIIQFATSNPNQQSAIYSNSGDPNSTIGLAANGSIYLRNDGVTGAEQLYVRTPTTWEPLSTGGSLDAAYNFGGTGNGNTIFVDGTRPVTFRNGIDGETFRLESANGNAFESTTLTNFLGTELYLKQVNAGTSSLSTSLSDDGTNKSGQIRLELDSENFFDTTSQSVGTTVTTIHARALARQNINVTDIGGTSSLSLSANNLFGTSEINFSSGSNNYITSATGQGLRLRTNGNVTALTLAPNGNIGIGTITPNTRLEVTSGFANNSGLRLTNLTSATPGAGGSSIGVDSLGNIIRVSGNDSILTYNGLTKYGAGNLIGIGGTLATNTYITTGGSEFGLLNGLNYFKVDGTGAILNTGNNGFGVANPTERVDISGNLKFSNALMPAGLSGTTGQVLVSQGVGVAPIWGTAMTGANNGLSVSSSTVQLGGPAGAASSGNLLSNREIPMNGNSLAFTNGSLFTRINANGSISNNFDANLNGNFISNSDKLGIAATNQLRLTSGSLRLDTPSISTDVQNTSWQTGGANLTFFSNSQSLVMRSAPTNSGEGAYEFTTQTSGSAAGSRNGIKLSLEASGSAGVNQEVGQSISVTDNTAVVKDIIGLSVNAGLGSNTNSTRYAALFNGGAVGIGISAPTNRLTVEDTSTTNVARFNGSGSTQCTVVTGTGLSCTSDGRLKSNINTLAESEKIIDKLRGVSYVWNQGSGKQIGFIAQEVEAVIPEAVTTDTNGYKSLNQNAILPYLVEAVKLHSEKLQNSGVVEAGGFTLDVENIKQSWAKELPEIKSRLSALEASDKVQNLEIQSLKIQNQKLEKELAEIKELLTK